MSEISRKKHIERLKAYLECEKKQVEGIWEECNKHLCDSCDLCYAQGNVGEYIASITKAISDMEKLEKIEQKEEYKGCNNCKHQPEPTQFNISCPRWEKVEEV